MSDIVEIAVVGAHMSGLPLNGQLTALGGTLLREAATLPCYRLYALPGGPPARPGLLRVAANQGEPIAVEVWAIPTAQIGALLAAIPAPLGLGTLRLADGTTPKGFLVEAEGVRGAEDISSLGGWRRYIAARAAAAT
jgi:allophanate hydrolase